MVANNTKSENQFYSYISKILQSEKEIVYEWRENNTEIIFKKNSDDGFDILVGCHNNNYIYLDTGIGYHDHFEAFEKFEEILIEVMGLVRDLLTQKMRIIEILSNNKPRKWLLQIFEEDKWKTEYVTGTLFWNIFGKRTTKVYSNDILPVRYE